MSFSLRTKRKRVQMTKLYKHPNSAKKEESQVFACLSVSYTVHLIQLDPAAVITSSQFSASGVHMAANLVMST
jgi:hypothetical protein